MEIPVHALMIPILLIALPGAPFAQTGPPEIFINEFMADNSHTILSPDFQEAADWLELYNAADSIIDLSGYYLTDDLASPRKWVIPYGTTIRPGWHLLFWADGRDTLRHLNFSLSKDGEQIGLFSPDGQVVDTLTFSAQISDISYGRYPDGGQTWYFFDKPTPAADNSEPGFGGIPGDVQFTPSGGFFQSSVEVELTCDDADAYINYSLDGSPPDENSALYTTPLHIDRTTVIRARAGRDGFLPGKLVTRTFFIDETTTLPVVSVATDPANLWDDQTGIYVEGTNGITGYCSTEPRNWNQPWERPVSIELYEADRSFGFRIDAGMQIGGGCTRLYPQKTLAIYARAAYGAAKLNYRIFRDKPIDTYNNINLRNNGQDWWRALFRDGMMQTLVKDRMDIDWQAYKPAVVFLNGEYWGIHDIREKHNEHYLAANYGIDPDKIDILDNNANVIEGSADLYTEIISFVQTHNPDDPANYTWLRQRMDVNEYMNYLIAEIYFANIDWPGGNIKYWRQQGENHKWRWILYDTDLGYGAHDLGQYYSNTLENVTSEVETYYANPPWSTLLIRKMLENTDFRNQFIQRFASHLNTTFYPQRALHIIDSLKANIEGEIPRHIQKWEKSTSFNGGWQYHVNVIHEFATRRPGYIIDQLTAKFGLSGIVHLSVQVGDPGMGSVFINDVEIPDQNFNGVYFKDIPLLCKAVPAEGCRFAGWEGAATVKEDSVAIILNSDATLTAVFIREQQVMHGLRINEILALNDRTNTDPHGEYDDWIELYNDSDQPVDIGGLFFTDDLNDPAKDRISSGYPDSTTIPPGGYTLLWADNDTSQGILHLSFQLNGDGEEIGLFRQTDSGMAVIDTLVFGSQTVDVSFGRYPDGMDETEFFSIPTPGYANFATGIARSTGIVPVSTHLEQNYPNPFNPFTTIRWHLAAAGHAEISVYNLIGKRVAILTSGQFGPGGYSVRFNGSNLASGVYYVVLDADAFRDVRKMLLIR
jgi:hypothetical protein